MNNDIKTVSHQNVY